MGSLSDSKPRPVGRGECTQCGRRRKRFGSCGIGERSRRRPNITSAWLKCKGPRMGSCGWHKPWGSPWRCCSGGPRARGTTCRRQWRRSGRPCHGTCPGIVMSPGRCTALAQSWPDVLEDFDAETEDWSDSGEPGSPDDVEPPPPSATGEPAAGRANRPGDPEPGDTVSGLQIPGRDRRRASAAPHRDAPPGTHGC